MNDQHDDPGAMLALLCQRIANASSRGVLRTRMGGGVLLRSGERSVLLERAEPDLYSVRLILLDPVSLAPVSQAEIGPVPRHHARVRALRWLDHAEDRPDVRAHLTPPEIWDDRRRGLVRGLRRTLFARRL